MNETTHGSRIEFGKSKYYKPSCVPVLHDTLYLLHFTDFTTLWTVLVPLCGMD